MRSRIRTIKPEFFDDPVTGTLEPLARLLFIGMLTLADKRGRLADEPQRIQVRVLPYDRVRIEVLLDSLVAAGLIVRYIHQGQDVIWIKNFEKHQHINLREPESVLPAYEEGVTPARMCVHVQAPSARRVRAHGEREGNGKGTGTGSGRDREGIGIDHLAVIDVHAPDETKTKSAAMMKALDEGFARFWSAYPLKHGKKIARVAWNKIAPDDALVDTIVAAVEQQKTWRKFREGFVPLPTTWLNRESWNDEPEPTRENPKSRTAGNLAAAEQAIEMIRRGKIL